MGVVFFSGKIYTIWKKSLIVFSIRANSHVEYVYGERERELCVSVCLSGSLSVGLSGLLAGWIFDCVPFSLDYLFLRLTVAFLSVRLSVGNRACVCMSWPPVPAGSLSVPLVARQFMLGMHRLIVSSVECALCLSLCTSVCVPVLGMYRLIVSSVGCALCLAVQ